MSGSPSSDYDPLTEEMQKQDEARLSDEDQLAASPGSSLGQGSEISIEPNSLDQYAITPPANHREMKRNSEKRRHHTVGSGYHAQLAKRLNKRQVGVHGLEPLSDVSCEIEGSSPDTSAFIPPLTLLKNPSVLKKDKNATKDRSFDRELKRRASDAATMYSSSPSRRINLNSSLNLKVDSPNRFMSLQSKPVNVSENKSSHHTSLIFPKSEEGETTFPRRSTSYSNLECPHDRIEFHRTFSALINLHNNPEKKKKDTDTGSKYSRQLSSEMEMYQTELADIMWLELQARLSNHGIAEHDMHLYKLRNTMVSDVLEDIKTFIVTGLSLDKDNEEEGFVSIRNTSEATKSIRKDALGGYYSFAKGRTVFDLQLVGEQLKTVISDQEEALSQVRVILGKLDVVESLYPTHKALAKNYQLYTEKAIENRLDALNLWLNITTDIAKKLSLMASVLYVDKITGIAWPWLSDQTPTTANGLGSSASTESVSISASSSNDHLMPGRTDPNPVSPDKKAQFTISDISSCDVKYDQTAENGGITGVNDGLSDGLSDKSGGLSDRDDELSSKDDGLSDKDDGLSDKDDDLSDKNDGLSDKDDGLSDKNDGLSDKDDGLSDKDDGLSDKDDGLSDKNDGLSDKDDGLSDRDVGLSDKNDGLSDKDDGLSDKDDGLSDKNDGLSDKDDGLSDKDDGLSDRNDGLSDKDDGLSDKDDSLSDKDDGLSNKNDGLSDKDDGLSDKNDGLSDKDDGLRDNGSCHQVTGSCGEVKSQSEKLQCSVNTDGSSNPCIKVNSIDQSNLPTQDMPRGGSCGFETVNIGIDLNQTGFDATPTQLNADSVCHSTPNSSSRKGSGKMSHVRFAETPLRGHNDSSTNLIGPSPDEKPPYPTIYRTQRSTSNISSISRSDSTFSFDENSRTSMYRPFVEKHLKKMGLRKLMIRLKGILDGTLQRARQALEAAIDEGSANLPSTEPTSPSDIFRRLGSSPSMDGGPTQFLPEPWDSVLHHEPRIFAEMNLPSFLPTYLFLLRLPLDVVHECLRLRYEQRPVADTEPSILSIRQLIRECKEVLLGGGMIKMYYQQMVRAVLPNIEADMDNDLQQFEQDLEQILDVYFDYMRIYMSQLQMMSEMSKRLKNFLEDEWLFAKRVCPHVRGGEAKAGKHFCLMASSLLESIGHFLDSNMDICMEKLYDSMLLEDDSDDFGEKRSNVVRSGEVRKGIATTCRTFKETFSEARERASKALGFAKLLRKDLEIAADFEIHGTPEDLFESLLLTQHVEVVAPHNPGYLLFVPEQLSRDVPHIIQLLNVSCGFEDSSLQHALADEGYLILVTCTKCAQQDRCTHWKGRRIRVEPSAETTIALSHIQVEGLFLVVIQSSQLHHQRSEFGKMMGQCVHLVNEQTSCHQAIGESLIDLRESAMDLREDIANAIAQADEKLSVEQMSDIEEAETANIQKLYRETLHQCYSFGFEYHRDLIRLVSGDKRASLAKHIVKFAILWMRFVTEKCERGKGVKPRWSKPGLDFLCVACEPRVTAYITESEFNTLKTWMNACILHVIGDRTHPSVSPARPGSPLPLHRTPMPLHRNMSYTHGMSRNASRQTSQASNSSSDSAPAGDMHMERKSSMPVNMWRSVESDLQEAAEDEHADAQDILSYNADDTPILRRRRAQIDALEHAREQKLYSMKQIGRITEKQQQVEVYIANKKVNFKWQRGIKIGEGQFGKVYTVVNTDSGELMAVKEIRFQPNDHQTIKNVSEEIKNFEDLEHPGLVRYFGVEIHRDEMLIFMEYCANGTIEDVAKQGLDEPMVRKYTLEILQAVAYLHERNIMHRDIKGANIFLTLDGPVKLGDFGCAVKLKSHTTMPGEVESLVGTTAFMAPEVIKNDKPGSGRASDIWSVGCVVIEMVAGKRPWHELKTNFNIIYRVGTGGTPAIPESLSHEGKQFLSAILVHNPTQRPTASDLLFHPFLKVVLDEDTY